MPHPLKPDMPETLARFEAWWTQQPTDRPLISLYTRQRRPDAPAIPPGPATLEERWLNPAAIVDRAAAHILGSYYPGDSIPLYNPNLGPVITSALFDAPLEFDTHTSWCNPL